MIQTGESYVSEIVLKDDRRLKADADWEAERSEIEEFAVYYKRASAGVWTWLAVITVAVAAFAVYGYMVLQHENIQLAQIPAMSNTIPALNQHIVGLGKQLNAWSAEQQQLSQRVRDVDTGWRDALGRTSTQTHELLGQVQANLSKELGRRSNMFQSELIQLANERSSDRTRLAKLESQLAEARFDLESARNEYSQNLEVIREQQRMQNRELVTLTSLHETKQIPFVAQKNKDVQLGPGVMLKLTKVDATRQLFNGWISSVSGKQKIFVENQGVQMPVAFFAGKDGDSFKLVMTEITPQTASGYLLVPAASAQPASTLSATTSADDIVDSSAILPVSDKGATDPFTISFQPNPPNPQQ